jgi:lipid-A-disaccharide synthase-like uncharacterized protein
MDSVWNFILEFIPHDSPYDMMWAGIGVFGQVLFMSRFLIQLYKSEKAKRSVLPIEFWYFSIAGGLITLSYAIHRRDLVFTVAQMLGLIIYARNLVLVYRERRANAELAIAQAAGNGSLEPHKVDAGPGAKPPG